MPMCARERGLATGRDAEIIVAAAHAESERRDHELASDAIPTMILVNSESAVTAYAGDKPAAGVGRNEECLIIACRREEDQAITRAIKFARNELPFSAVVVLKLIELRGKQDVSEIVLAGRVQDGAIEKARERNCMQWWAGDQRRL